MAGFPPRLRETDAGELYAWKQGDECGPSDTISGSDAQSRVTARARANSRLFPNSHLVTFCCLLLFFFFILRPISFLKAHLRPPLCSGPIRQSIAQEHLLQPARYCKRQRNLVPSYLCPWDLCLEYLELLGLLHATIPLGFALPLFVFATFHLQEVAPHPWGISSCSAPLIFINKLPSICPGLWFRNAAGEPWLCPRRAPQFLHPLMPSGNRSRRC